MYRDRTPNQRKFYLLIRFLVYNRITVRCYSVRLDFAKPKYSFNRNNQTINIYYLYV